MYTFPKMLHSNELIFFFIVNLCKFTHQKIAQLLKTVRQILSDTDQHS